MNYQLNKPENQKKKETFSSALKRLWPFLKDEKRNLAVAFVAILATSVLTLLSPVIISYTIDTYIQQKDFHGVLRQKQWEASAEERFSICEMPFLQSCRSYPLLFSIKIKQGILFPGSTTIPIF
jgi:ABC-type multidrug transport system fused ATPase/permease subunit